jgi:ATP-binding cassette subfamily C (CFTR/MRP) protein 1
MYRVSGWSATNGQISYVPQQAWIQNLSVRENILFGQPMKEGFYDAVVDKCALTQDMIVLSAGDATEIGEKGIKNY